jgi:hypothetical protein
VKNTPHETTIPNSNTPIEPTAESNILDDIILFCGIALLILLSIFFYFRSRPNNLPAFETKTVPATSIATALDQIREHLSKKYHLRTESCTTQELLEIEKNPEQKLILQKCLQAIQLREYKKAPVSDSEILHLLEQYLTHEPRNTHS